MNKSVLVLTILISTVFVCSGQNDTLMSYDSKALRTKMLDETNINDGSSGHYSKELLRRARKSNKTLDIAEGLYNAIKYGDDREVMIAQSNELLKFTEKMNLNYYPGIALYMKGVEKYVERDYTKALNFFIKADSVLLENPELTERYWVLGAIGNLKTKIGDLEGAKQAYKTVGKFYERENDLISYGRNAISLSNLLALQKKPDSAELIIKDAQIKLNGLKHKTVLFLDENLGIIEYDRKNYRNAIDIFTALLPKLDSIGDIANMATVNSYLGQCYFDTRDTLNGVVAFKNAINGHQEKELYTPSVRSALKELRIYYNRTNKLDEELEILSQLIHLDSIETKNKSELEKGIYKSYDLPKYLERKDEIIALYDKADTNKKRVIYGIAGAMLLMGVFFFVRMRNASEKHRQYKKVIAELKANNAASKKKVSVSKKSIVPDKDVKTLNAAFEKYTIQKSFLSKGFNKSFIVKDTGVNDHYVADYFRDYIGKSSTEYVNEKRIDEAVLRMYNDSDFSKYTMAAMAEEIGYANSTTFKRAFKKQKGLSPMDFINEMNSDNS